MSGTSRDNAGVVGEGSFGDGVQGLSHTAGHSGVAGFNSSTGPAVFGQSTGGFAGDFHGRVRINGSIFLAAGSVTIDHPLEPENKYLSHSFVESPDMLNVYSGNVMTDAQGEAVVSMPDYFGALNQDFRYQLTVIEQFAQAIVASEIKDNYFEIKTDKPHVKVSWAVTGVRQDAYAKTYRISVEQDKPEEERGRYLHPELWGQAKEAGIGWVSRPQDQFAQAKQLDREAEELVQQIAKWQLELVQ